MTPAISIMDPLITLVNSTLDVAGVVDLFLSLLKEVFQRYLSVKHADHLVKHDKTVRVSNSVLYRIVFRKNIISKE